MKAALCVYESVCLGERQREIQRHRETESGHTFLCSRLLTGPTQLRTITACLHMAAKESGSPTSATMMSTSDLSSGLPARTHKHKYVTVQVPGVRLSDVQ